MNSDYKDKRVFRSLTVLHSFRYAITGILNAIRNERNMKIHVVTSMIVIVLGMYFSISGIEWLFIALAIGGMLSLELLNSSVERVVDLITDEYHELAKQAKDMAAGAVFIYALLSIVIGLIIFVPKIFLTFF